MRSNFDRPHWSFSALSQYLRCPLSFYFERVVKLPKRTVSDALVLGSAVHSALAHYHRRLQFQHSVDPAEVQGSFLQAWQERHDSAEVVQVENRSNDDVKAQGIALLELYLQLPAPQEIIAIEQPILVPVSTSRGEYLEKPLLVIPDLITRDGGLPKVREIKTANRAYSESEVAASLQPTFYGNAVYELTGEEPAIEFTVLIKTKSPKIQLVDAIRNSADFVRLGDVIQAVDQAVDAGIFYPVENPMNCSGCPFYRPCREWTGTGMDQPLTHAHPKELVPC